MLYVIWLIAGIVLVETSELILNCTNDYDKLMSCYNNAFNCSGLRMTLEHPDKAIKGTCVFSSCVKGCCCSTELILVTGDQFVAKVYKEGQSVHVQTIGVSETIKPKTPSIIGPVSQLNSIYQIQWKTNAKQSIREELMAIVTYQKKGNNNKVSNYVKPNVNVDMNYFDILGRNLESSTTYEISVKTYTTFNVFSDSSEEREFTTASSTDVVLIAVTILLCVAAVVLSGGAFISFIKIKGKIWDNAAKDEKPKHLDIKPGKKKILTPEVLHVYSLSVEPLISKEITLSKESLSDTSGRSGQTSGISTASSSLNYASTEPVDMEQCVLQALKNVFPIIISAEDTFSSQGPTQNCLDPPSFEKTSSPIFFDNRSYISPKTNPTNAVDMQMNFDSGYHTSNGLMPHDFVTSSNGSAVMETDMSYRPCPQPEEASSDSPKVLTVDYGYQDFEKLVEQSNKVEECQSVILDLINNTQTADVAQPHCATIPHVSNEIIVDHGYHCV